MSDSLGHGSSTFTGLKLNHLRVLIGLVTQQELREKDYVKRRYSEQASEFDRTLAFLTGMRLVNDDGRTLSPNSELETANQDRDELSHVVLRQLGTINNGWREELFAYLCNFRVLGDTAIHRPTADQRSSESAVRNFLIDLAAVAHDPNDDRYVLRTSCHSLFAQACKGNPVRPSRIQSDKQAREDIGLAAELVVFEYERQRVGPQLADRVEHVALYDAAAGFDIESVTIGSCDIVPRFIEVKAVPPSDFRFYWTANEIAVSRTFGSWYYLYLLPIGSNGQPKADLLRVVCDPHNAVLERPEEWTIEANVVQCQLTASAP